MTNQEHDMFDDAGNARQRDNPHLSVVPPDDPNTVDSLLKRSALGDEEAFTALYDQVAGRVYGLCLRVIRDPAQAEEVAQEVLLDVWRRAAHFDADKGSGLSWITTMAHRRSVDRVRSVQASTEREKKAEARNGTEEYDQVSETVTNQLEYRQVRRCMNTLTELQRQAITLAYFGGHTYRHVAQLLDSALPTVKSRIRDGLIRLRDCLEVAR